REEGPRADVEGDEAPLHAALLELGQGGRGEMQPGGGRGDRAVDPGIDRLVAEAILRRGLAVDIGRKRDPSGALEQRADRAVRLEPDPELALAQRPDDRRLPSVELDDGARPQTLARLTEADPVQRLGGAGERAGCVDVGVRTDQEELHSATAPVLASEQP